MCFLGAPRLVIKEEQTDAKTSPLARLAASMKKAVSAPSALAFA